LTSFTGETGPSEANPDPSNKHSSSNTENSDQYGTPRWLIRRLQQALGNDTKQLFDLDPASGAEPIPIAETQYTEEIDGLTQPWALPSIDTIYLNPPYSDPEPFLQKLKEAIDPDDPAAASLGISLTKSDTSTKWFHNHLTEAKVICFLDTRLSFYGGDQGAKFPNAIGVFGDPNEELLETLSDIGELYSRVEVESALEQQRLDDLVSDGGCVAGIPIRTPADNETALSPTYTSLDFVSPRDIIEMSFDTSSLGTQTRDLPEEVQVAVLPNGKEIDPHTGTISIDAAGKTANGDDVCVSIRNSAEIASHLEVSIAVGSGGWELATPRTVNIIDG
jgi:hypothetical protein